MPKALKIGLVFLLIAAGVVLRFLCISPFDIPNGDTAVVGLLAIDILEGRDLPIYPPLAHYGGTLVSFLGALFFKLFGVSVPVFLMGGMLYSFVWGLFAYLLARRVVGMPAALFAFLFLVLPPHEVLFCSLWTAGVYAETFIFVSLLLWILCRWNDAAAPPLSTSAALGFLSGVGLWTTPWTFPILLTIGTVFFMRRECLSRKGVVLFLVAFLAGYLPSIIYEFQHPGAQLFRFGGRILALDRSALSSSDLLGTVVRKALWRLSTVPASLARIPVLSVSLVGGLNAAVFAAGLGVVAYGGRVREALRDKKLSSAAILLVFVVWYVIFYATLVGAKEARYMLPLMSLYPLFAGALGALLYKRSRALCLVVLALLLVNNGLDLRRFLSDRRPHGYKALTSWLQSHDLVYGYSDFETAYPVMFESLHEITMSPTLFHPTFSDRWPQQTAEVRKQDAVFVVDTRQRPQAAARIERSLGELGVSYKKAAVEEFFVYKDLSRRVLPEELDVSGEHP